MKFPEKYKPTVKALLEMESQIVHGNLSQRSVRCSQWTLPPKVLLLSILVSSSLNLFLPNCFCVRLKKKIMILCFLSLMKIIQCRIALRRTPNTKILSSFGPEWFGFSEAEYRFRRPLHHASSGTDWITMNLWNRLDRRFPHIKCTLISNEYAGDELLSSELLMITRLMWQRRIRSMTLDHDIVPILVFSLMGTQHVRILQAHFDGSTLIRLKSKTLDLTTRDDEALDLLGQWYCSDPVGNTMWDEPVRTGTV